MLAKSLQSSKKNARYSQNSLVTFTSSIFYNLIIKFVLNLLVKYSQIYSLDMLKSEYINLTCCLPNQHIYSLLSFI